MSADRLNYGPDEIEFETIGGEHDICVARFAETIEVVRKALRGYGMSRREAAIDLLRGAQALHIDRIRKRA